jgi:cell wall-associated NlpC family hydrolase
VAVTTLSAVYVAHIAMTVGFRGEALVKAIAIARAESGFDPKSVNVNNDQWRSRDRGLWQINDHWHPDVTDAEAFDPASCANAAYQISGGGRDFSAWSTYDPDPQHPNNNSAYRQYLPLAARAAKRVTGSDPSGDLATGAGGSGTPIRFLQPDTAPAINIRIGGQLVSTELSYALLSAPVSYTTQEASQLTLTFADSDFLILKRFKLVAGPEGTVIEAAGARWRIYSVGTQPGPIGPQTVIVCQPSGVLRMRGFTPRRVRNMSATDYLAMIAKAVGLDFHGEPTAAQPSVGPRKTKDPITGQKRQENAWEVGQRLAADHNFMCFESGSTYFFGTPQNLAEMARTWQPVPHGAQPDGADFGEVLELWGWPTVTDLAYGNTKPQRSFSMQIARDSQGGCPVRGGDEIWLAGFPGLGGRVTATVTNVQYDLGSIQPVTVQAADRSFWDNRDLSRIDQKALGSAVSPAALGTTYGSINSGGKSALDFVTVALHQVGDAYLMGAGRNTSDPNPDAFDCSGLVYWACAQVGVDIPSTSETQYAWCRDHHTLISVDQALHTRGALLFEAGSDGTRDNPGHVAISLGDGRQTIEARGTGYGVHRQPTARRPWSHGGLIPGMRYR